MSVLETYFNAFRKNIIGIDQTFESPWGLKKIVYADWTASGRMYGPIENMLAEKIAPYVANTHTETNFTGNTMTKAYHEAKHIIKSHIGANENDVLICSDSGMTGVVNKLQRILGVRLHEKFRDKYPLDEAERPVVFITHMEHHSNQTSWLETTATVEIIRADKNGLVDLSHFAELLEKHKHKKLKIAAVTSCSNVTGIYSPYHKIAGMIHRYGGFCFVDFACSAPYIDINMHPENPQEHLDAIYFSPHKFLGGPSSAGVLVFNKILYSNKVPDNPGGGTVDWTNPWGEHKYYDEVEAREDGGTPAFLQTIRIAYCILLKEKMGTAQILQREEEILKTIWEKLDKIQNLKVLAGHQKHRLGVISFYIEHLHYNLGVKLLNDRFGIQMRGGCSCAGTYGHYLLEVDYEQSKTVTSEISKGILTNKPGWIRMSIHPVMTNDEIGYILNAVQELALNFHEWAKDYMYNPKTNDFKHINDLEVEEKLIQTWFDPAVL